MVNFNICEEKIVEEILEQAATKTLKSDFLTKIEAFNAFDSQLKTTIMFIGPMYLSEFMREVIKKLNEKENN